MVCLLIKLLKEVMHVKTLFCMTNDLSGPPSVVCNCTYTSESGSSTGQQAYQLVAVMR